MGRAIVRNPKVFLFDEPLSNLDAKLRIQMRTEIKKLHQRVQTTVIYVTHDQVEAMTLADRIVVMRSGHVEQVGSPDAIYREPASTFVATFMGAPTMNLVPTRLESGPDGLTIGLGEELRLPVPCDRIRRYAEHTGRDVILGLRPEHLVWAPDHGAGAIDAVASVVEPLGADTLVFFELNGREMVSRVPPGAAYRAGDRVRLKPDLAGMHLFDPTTERALG